ncbi:DEAD/DEAH box helicase family protein [Mycobacterium yunnanensis]|uniref:DEAD/DEAH box helicase family protein n=1 Tax=Mycobacterium yunnanensis TaxID=368477 RepID=A0A9X2Z239_9MYCO|nr:helicase-related protein [Mycobacterium yunnanensis]MCV7421376.1 DEAD/DEAH box helicase family protein [Mycobacterium yunnanensis]
MIEKRITQQLLEAGELALTGREQAALGLPEHSTTVSLDLEGESFQAQWSGRSRKLSGEVLSERLQDYGQSGGLLRLRLVESVYRLLLLPPGAVMEARQTYVPPPPVKSQSVRTAMQRRATVDRQFHYDDEYRWNEGTPRTIGFLSDSRRMLGEQLKAAGFDALELVELRLQGEELATLDDFEELLAVDVANVDRMPHQEAVARHALSRLRGRAVLADEVGLGKTIEAGLAVKELTLRGLAKRVLILCPAPLRDQWREEMNLKFDLPFDVAYSGADIRDQDKLILSLTLARNRMKEIIKQPWDIVIIDEAHRAAGAGAKKTRELITELTTACRYALFLTATPVQNDLLELYRLVELLRPGTFTSVAEFKRKYMTRFDPRTPNDPAALRRLISSVMIRTTRAQAGVDRVTRRAVDVPVTLGPREQELYALSTDLLRNVMRDSGDTMRRRSLALRLTASPFSMGTTALRMAERHPSERVRRVLSEVGHLAMDIQGSARENKAMEITSKWVREHGRVLVFTQHTDTVTGLLRRMESEGLRARSFHGSMSAAERARTIAAFRSGEVPVMISTDAGAEGQNLQFCNCVLNYDLPWNPMRIEQRIGRVDRLTQPRDEVFIANLYARSTIDERVYQLLAQKLRMFELLFGQVTTILGELDDSKSATFETRVMEALFADTDLKMGRLLEELGTELVVARESASTLIAADSGFSNWMATSFDHREGLTKEGAAELRPEVTERARMRQRRVQGWVRQVLTALDARILHDTGEGDGAFLTVQFDEEMADELGGRAVMHLAFDRIGMEHHPDAELCAVGSPVFDELLGLLRMRGDLHATVPVIPDDIGPSPYRHAESTQLISRHLVPSNSWSGQATFRATVGEAETTEHIVTADLNGHHPVSLARRPLGDGESLPPAIGLPHEIVSEFEKQASSQLERLRRDRVKSVEREQRSELKRIQEGYKSQIDEVYGEDRARLRRALDSEEKRLGRSPDIRARAKMLAITLDEDDWLVEERWSGPGGVEGSFTYEWGFSPPVVESDASAAEIGTLALCSDGHWIDESEVAPCDSCDDHLCIACGDDAVFAECPVCGGSCCGRCRSATGGLCRPCDDPVRAPALDREHAIAWRFNRGTIMYVGERAAELLRPGDPSPHVIVPDRDVTDPARVRMRSYAMHNALPADSGLILRDLTTRPESGDDRQLHLRAVEQIDVELSTADAASSKVTPAATNDLPNHPSVAVHGEGAFGLAALLPKLRRKVPPPPPPSVMVTRRSTFTDLVLKSDRLVELVSVVADDGTASTQRERTEYLEWVTPVVYDSLVAAGELAGMRVTVERRNDALLLTANDAASRTAAQRWVALPPDGSVEDQLAWFAVLESAGAPGGRVGRRMGEASAMVESYPSPNESWLVDRTIIPVAELAEVDGVESLQAADHASLAALEGRVQPKPTPQLDVAPPGLASELLDRSQRGFSSVVRSGFEISETWQGHGIGHRQYRAFDGLPIAPTLDDTGRPANEFGICRDGHFHEEGTSAQCESCRTTACRACDDLGHQASLGCPRCSAQVCRRCVSADHHVPDVQCRSCGDVACPECGRDPEVTPCVICERSMCATCRTGSLCEACTRLAPASDDVLRALPIELAWMGATVVAAEDEDATIALISRGDITEQATVRDGHVERWVSYGLTQLDEAYRLRLSASRQLGTQVVPERRHLEVDLRITVPHMVVRSEQRHFAEWTVESLGQSGRSTHGFDTPRGELVELIAKRFPVPSRLPEPVRWMPNEVRNAVRQVTSPRVRPLVMRWTAVGRRTAVIGDGLVDQRYDGSTVVNSVVPWSDHAIGPGWFADSWNPAPTIRASAVCEPAHAVIGVMASMLVLGVRVGQDAKWFSIANSPQTPGATALARSMGLPDADEIVAFTDPRKITRSTVLNATNVALNVIPAGFVNNVGFQSNNDVTPEALAAWLPGVDVKHPALGHLDQYLRQALLRRFHNGTGRSKVKIGAAVDEVVTVEGGHTWRNHVTLSPGDVDARRLETKTRTPLAVGVIDREGHFSPVVPQCNYCGGKICGLCVDGFVACDCCDAQLCKRCIREPQTGLWLCPACSTMRRPTRSEAREHGRLLSTRKMLIGVDDLHEVAVEFSKQHWSRENPDGDKKLVANPAVSAFLNERLAASAGDSI